MKKSFLLTLAVSLAANVAPEMCFNEAWHDYGIVPLLLTVISIKESRLTRTAINGSDMDGTEDVCGIQISRSHYKKLSKFNISRNDYFMIHAFVSTQGMGYCA